MVKNPLQHRRPRFNPWVRKIPWRREWLPIPVFLHGECHEQRSLVGYSPWVCIELDTTEWLTYTHRILELLFLLVLFLKRYFIISLHSETVTVLFGYSYDNLRSGKVLVIVWTKLLTSLNYLCPLHSCFPAQSWIPIIGFVNLRFCLYP